MAAATTPIKVVLFDIGGVVVDSPMSAIATYEQQNSMPPGWINFSISRSGPTGAWAQLERGEIPLDAAFFKSFKDDLTRPDLWREYIARTAAKSGYDVSGSVVRDTLAGVGSAAGGVAAAMTTSTPTPVLSAAGADTQAPKLPPVPDINTEKLFWEMMRVSRTPDKHMLAAVKKLRASGRFLIAALSNTSIFPAGHEYNKPPQDPSLDYKGLFEVFVSSAHVGMRKPEPAIYELALRLLQEKWTEQGREGKLRPEDVLFLDDIGTNLRQGKKMGFRTLKVELGDTKSAVRELENITGMQLLDDEAKL